MNATETIHVTKITKAGEVWGHSDAHCDEAGCAAGADLWYSQVDASEVEKHGVYEIAEDGKVLSRAE